MGKKIESNINFKILMVLVISLFITFFSCVNVKAYYRKNVNRNVSFTTKEYTDLTSSLNKTIYASGNNSTTVELTINNPNNYNVTYILSFSNTNATYLIDGASSTTYEVNANSANMHVVSINGATGTNITVSINVLVPYSVTHTKVINFDNVNPTVNDIGGGTVLKSTSQSLTLKCSDNNSVTAYYFGTTEPTSVSGVNTTTSADLTALASSSGLSKTINAEGTYWLACRDAAGNFAKKSIVIRKYQVQNVLAKLGGSVTPYTSTNYELNGSASTYYVKNGTTLTLTSIYTIPASSTASTFKGYTTSAPSTTAQTPSTTNPVVASNNTTTYYMWFDRTTRVLTYDFNTANNMNYWLYYMYQERFSISYDSNTKMSTLSVAGAGGWEIVYMPIATVSGKRYRVEFDYINPNGYSALSSSYGGIGVQALTTIANNDNLSNDLETIYLSTAQNNNTQHLNIEFTATGTNTYLAFNFGMTADGVINTVKLGNFKIVETLTHGASASSIPSLSRTGYTFDGWYTATSGGTKLTTSTAINSNITYYAHDSQNNYTITYNLNGGSASNSGSYNINTTTITLNNPTRSGATFMGWAGSNDLSTGTSAYTTSSPYVAGTRDHFIGNDFAVTAGNTYRIFIVAKRTAGAINMRGGIWYTEQSTGSSWDGYSSEYIYLETLNDGWARYYKDVTVPEGKTRGKIYVQIEQQASNPTTTWHVADAHAVSGTTVTIPRGSTGNKTYNAYWNVQYTLTLRYNVNGGTITTGTGSERWRASSSLVQRSTDSGSSWTTITAVLNAATTDYDLWNVGTYGATKTGYTINSDSAYNTKADGTGVNINQQNTSSNTTNAVTVARINGGVLTANKTIDIYIKWVETTATLTYSANGCGTAPSNVTMKYTAATNAASSMTMGSGWTFTGWNTASGGNGTAYAAGAQVKAANVVPSAITLYAQCTKSTTYTASYNGNGSTGGSTSSTSCTSTARNGGSFPSCNVTLASNGFSKTGYNFSKWAIDSASGTQYSAGGSVSIGSNKTFYAVWSEKTATLTYNANNCGTAPSNVTMKYTTATNAASSMSMASGWTFTGWNTASGGNGTAYAAGAQVKAANVVPSAITLYAQCSKTTTYTVTYNGNDNTGGSTSSSSCTSTARNGGSFPSCSVSLRSNGFTKSGWNFNGWGTATTSTSGDGAGTSISLTGNVTRYATWKKNAITYTVSFSNAAATGATVTSSQVSCTIAAVYNGATQGTSCNVTLPTSGYSYSGWTFNGWGTATTSTSGNTGTISISSSHTRYATWYKSITRTASYNTNGGDGGSTSASTCSFTAYNGSTSGSCSVTLRTCGFTKTYADFTKWAIDSASGTQYAAGASVSISSDKTFYALWAPRVYIYFSTNGGTENSSTYSTINNWISENGTSYFYQTVTVNDTTDLYNYGTGRFEITRSGYTVPTGSEWCTGIDGTGTCYDQDANYTYSQYKDASSYVTTGAAPYYELDLYVHWNQQIKWRWRATCSCHASSVQSKYVYSEYNFNTSDEAFFNCNNAGAGLSACRTWCSGIGGTGANATQCLGMSNQ